MGSSRRLLLVDGTSVAYRAYFAIRSLSTRAGRPTNAVFGFIRMLRQMADVWAPTHWAVAFDGGLPEKRTGLLAEYKAQRPRMPESLSAQLEDIGEYLDRADITRIRVEGHEADDVLASLAARAPAGIGEILIATRDKDLYQVVDEKRKLVPVAGRGKETGPAEVRTASGVAPEQVVAWLALAGDSVDNIPGVPGVGPKTAAALLGRYGSLEEMWRRLDEWPSAKVRRALAEHRDEVARNVELVRLDRDLDIPVNWDRLKRRPPSAGKLLPFFEELEFHSMARELKEPGLFPG